MMRLSVVVPVLDEAETIADHLDSWRRCAPAGPR